MNARFRHVNTSLKKLVEGVKTNAQTVDIEEDDLDELVCTYAKAACSQLILMYR